MILEPVKVGHTIATLASKLLVARVVGIVAMDMVSPLIGVVYGGVLGETLRRTVRLLRARLAHFIIIIKPLNFIK